MVMLDAAKAQPKRKFIIRIQPEYRHVFPLVSSDVFDCQLCLSNSSKPVKDDCRSANVTIKQLMHLRQLLLSGNKLCSFRK
jgi:hypothetical protein